MQLIQAKILKYNHLKTLFEYTNVIAGDYIEYRTQNCYCGVECRVNELMIYSEYSVNNDGVTVRDAKSHGYTLPPRRTGS